MRDEGSSRELCGVRYAASRYLIAEELWAGGPGLGSWETGDGYSWDVWVAVVARKWSLPSMD